MRDDHVAIPPTAPILLPRPPRSDAEQLVALVRRRRVDGLGLVVVVRLGSDRFRRRVRVARPAQLGPLPTEPEHQPLAVARACVRAAQDRTRTYASSRRGVEAAAPQALAVPPTHAAIARSARPSGPRAADRVRDARGEPQGAVARIADRPWLARRVHPDPVPPIEGPRRRIRRRQRPEGAEEPRQGRGEAARRAQAAVVCWRGRQGQGPGT